MSLPLNTLRNYRIENQRQSYFLCFCLDKARQNMEAAIFMWSVDYRPRDVLEDEMTRLMVK